MTYVDRIVRELRQPPCYSWDARPRPRRARYLAHGEITEHILAEFLGLAEEDVRAVMSGGSRPASLAGNEGQRTYKQKELAQVRRR